MNIRYLNVKNFGGSGPSSRWKMNQNSAGMLLNDRQLDTAEGPRPTNLATALVPPSASTISSTDRYIPLFISNFLSGVNRLRFNIEASKNQYVDFDMGTRDEIIARLRQLPEVLNQTDGQIAEVLGITSSAWANYKSEHIEVTIRPKVALELWNAYGVPMEWVYDGQTVRTPDPELRAKLVAANRRAAEWLASRRPSGGRTTRIAVLVVAGAILLGGLQSAGLAWNRTDGLPIGLMQFNADRLACRGEARDHTEHPLLGDSEDKYASDMAVIYIGCMSEKGYTPNGDWHKP